ncbi:MULTISPECIES: hypothetical protein [unclassified Anabaena]|uniref:hypothetical protein n=1 Tax=unclassified Anabaena TaxID=2619674 RepID=UPI00082F9DFF|nr:MULTISPECIES: hypothetical protein [unclassified Anabaena]
MLAQFQSLYPNGSLIAELVQIFQGKYVVRASVIIEGVTRATGMAAAETIEAAEDQARTRALMVLGMTNTPQTSVTGTAQGVSPIQVNSVVNQPGYATPQDSNFGSNQWSKTSDRTQDTINRFSPTTHAGSHSINDTPSQEFSPSLPATSYQEPEYDPASEDLQMMSARELDTASSVDVTASNVTPFTPRSYNTPENVTNLPSPGKKKKKAEPVDLSDVIAKTDVELQRLGWTPEQGREYLIKTYGKRGRTLLTEEELHSFLKYLESQPDPIAGF